MTHNLLKEHKEGDTVLVRVLDIDGAKKMLDLQEIVSHKRNWNKKDYLKNKVDKYKLNGSMLLDAKVLLQKEEYVLVELANQPKIIGFVGLQGVAVGEMVKNLTLQSRLQEGRVLFKAASGQGRKDSLVVLNDNSQTEKGDSLLARVTKIQSNNVFVQVSRNVMGRIHKSYQADRTYALEEKVQVEVLEQGKKKQGVQWLELVDSQRTDKDAIQAAYTQLQSTIICQKVKAVVP